MRHSTSVATSTAQADAGVFDFSFRDERYMPFEGAGAVSEWQITLPGAFRAFDYETVTDVVLGLSYTALSDDGFRAPVEADNAALQGSWAPRCRANIWCGSTRRAILPRRSRPAKPLPQRIRPGCATWCSMSS